MLSLIVEVGGVAWVPLLSKRQISARLTVYTLCTLTDLSAATFSVMAI